MRNGRRRTGVDSIQMLEKWMRYNNVAQFVVRSVFNINAPGDGDYSVKTVGNGGPGFTTTMFNRTLIATFEMIYIAVVRPIRYKKMVAIGRRRVGPSNRTFKATPREKR